MTESELTGYTENTDYVKYAVSEIHEAKRIDRSKIFADLPLYISAFVFLLGLVFGSFSLSLCEGNDCFGISDLLMNSYTSRSGATFWCNLLMSLLSLIPYIAFMLFFANSAFGFVVAPCAMLFRGFSIGLISGYFYKFYSLQGIGYFALIMLPALFISTVTLIMMSSDCIKLSLRYFLLLRNCEREQTLSLFFKLYIKRFGILCGVMAFSAVIDASMTACFIKYFTF